MSKDSHFSFTTVSRVACLIVYITWLLVKYDDNDTDTDN